MHNILLGLTGSVATIKAAKLVESLKHLGNVQIVATNSANYFIRDIEQTKIYFDEMEWPDCYKLGDPILHIELRRWASCLVIAPLGANTLAKITHGYCDNLLTSVVRAWDWNKPMFLAPAMNTLMWENPPTAEQLGIMENRGAKIIQPIEKKLACDDIGMGAMASIETITDTVNTNLRWKFPLKNCNGIPINFHPGAFGFHRRKNHHTGIDLYTENQEPVFAVEDGRVVNVDVFTGPKAGHNWWEETWGVMVEGASGVVNYGEVSPSCETNDVVKRGQQIGNVKRVLFPEKHRPDIPGHSTSMLHLELYRHNTRDFADWHDPEKNPNLLDPTPFLMTAENAPRQTLTWDNSEGKTVG